MSKREDSMELDAGGAGLHRTAMEATPQRARIDAGGAGLHRTAMEATRSDPEYRTRRSDTGQAAEKCSKRAFCPFLPRQTNFEYNARRAPDARNRRRHPPDSANNARISGEAKASPSRLPHLDSALRSPLPRT